MSASLLGKSESDKEFPSNRSEQGTRRERELDCNSALPEQPTKS